MAEIIKITFWGGWLWYIFVFLMRCKRNVTNIENSSHRWLSYFCNFIEAPMPYTWKRSSESRTPPGVAKRTMRWGYVRWHLKNTSSTHCKTSYIVHCQTIHIILTWHRRFSDQQRLSAQAEAPPLHYGRVDACDNPKCGLLGCAICGSGGLRSRSPLI